MATGTAASVRPRLVGIVPSPPGAVNHGVADILHGSLLAYAVSSSVAIVDVHDMHLVGLLHPEANGGLTSALCWFPDCHVRARSGIHDQGHLQMATGDNLGRVLLWDVLLGASAVMLEESPARLAEATRSGGVLASQGGVTDLAWVASGASGLLAVAMHPSTLLLLDPASGALVWRREQPGAEPITCLGRDPLDHSHLAVCAARGGIMVLRLLNPRADRVESIQLSIQPPAKQQQQVAPKVVSCAFSRTRELLFAATPSQVAVLDLELHGQVAAVALPAGYSAFSEVVAIQPHGLISGSPYGDGRPAGLETLICGHQDGTVSVWSCWQVSMLDYRLATRHSLLPDPPRSLSGASIQLIAMRGSAWRRRPAACSALADHTPPPVACVIPPKRGRQKTNEAPPPSNSLPDISQVPLPPSNSGSSTAFPGTESLLLAAVTADGRVWAWDLAVHLPEGAAKAAAVSSAAMAAQLLHQPQLSGLLTPLTRSISTFTVAPTPIRADGGATVTIAAVTGSGMVDVMSLRAGVGGTLLPVVNISLEAHREVVRGLRWLGNSPQLASFSCKKEKHGWRNSLVITDMLSRKSTPFRDVGPEVSPMLAIRSSPSGRHLLVLFRGAPSEIWVVGGSSPPHRVRVLDLPFTAVEWVLRSDAAYAPDTPSKWTDWSSGNPTDRGQHGSQLQPAASTSERMAEDVPEERIAFALGDGRVGVLAVKGRKVGDTHPKRPTHGLLTSSEYVAMALAAWGTNIVLGDAEGNIVRWDTSTGRSSSVSSGQGTVRRVQVAPSGLVVPRAAPPSMSDPIARVALLFSSGAWGVWELDARAGIRPVMVSAPAGELQLSAVPAAAAGGEPSRAGGGSSGAPVARVTDLYWLPLPMEGGNGGVLAVACEDASLSLIHVEERPGGGGGLSACSSGVGPSTPASSAPSTPVTARSILEGSPFRIALSKEGALSFRSRLAEARGNCTALVPPATRGSVGGILLPHPALLFLRLLLQVGVPLSLLQGDERPLMPAADGDGRMYRQEGVGDHDKEAGEQLAWLRAAAERSERRVWELLPRECWRLSRLLFHEAPFMASRHGGDQLVPPMLSLATGRAPLSQLSIPQSGFEDIVPANSPAAIPQPLPMTPVEVTPVSAGAEDPAVRRSIFGAGRGTGGAPPRGKAEEETEPMGDEEGLLMSELLQGLRKLRGGCPVLSLAQAEAYKDTLSFGGEAPPPASGSSSSLRRPRPSRAEHLRAEALAARMALAADIAGDPEETAFWEGLVGTLDSLRDRGTKPAAPHRPIATPERSCATISEADLSRGNVGEEGDGGEEGEVEALEESPRWEQHKAAVAAAAAAADESAGIKWSSPEVSPGSSPRRRRGRQLWDPNAAIREAQQRVRWQERLARGACGAASTLSADSLQAQQVLEYVTLGDFQTAVGFLLASTPEQTSRYFRNALCTISLAAATSPGNMSTSLHMQAAKVVAANTAAMGDTQLGVPLLCSVGLPAEAVTLLQDSGQWRHAATLAASQLRGSELSAALERWALHVAMVEKCVWRAAGLLTAGGCCRTALRLMKTHGYVDCAVPFFEICSLMGAPIREDGRDSIFTPAPSPMRPSADAPEPAAASAHSADGDTTPQEFANYVTSLLTSFHGLIS
mmetsp:Transcript_7354/g.20760  ORF Transcript_7354/g.20760 Transcript_7354/m.20760 type:complete len:1627 (+) Transcript_7354:108-4988(+)